MVTTRSVARDLVRYSANPGVVPVTRDGLEPERRLMPLHLATPAVLEAHGSPPNEITEHVGLASTGTDALNVAVMTSPPGWTEPAQAPARAHPPHPVRIGLHARLLTGTGAPHQR